MSMPSNIPRWNDVQADFRDSNQMFGIAQQGLSNAGTVFGQLRASILAEEQKNIDNAFREKQLSENIRQFGLTNAFREKQLSENIRQFGLTNALERDKFGETQRHNLVLEEDTDLDRTQRFNIANMQNRAAMAGVAAQNRSTSLREKMYNDEQNRLAIQTKVYQDILGEAQALEKEKADLIAGINSGTLTGDALATSKARLAQIDNIIRTDYTASALDKRIANEIAIRGGGVVPATSMSNEATAEQARTAAALTRNAEAEKSASDSYVKGASLITKTVTDADHRQAFGRAYDIGVDLVRGTKVKPEEIANILIQSGLRENFWGSGQSPTSDLKSFVDNPTNKENPIYQQIMQRAGKAVSTTGDTTKIPDHTPKEQPIRLSNLTDEALTYQREKILASLPSEPTPEQIQARFNQLVRESWGDMPIDKIPPNALKTLEERALQDTKAVIQKERARVTKPIDDEIRTRQRNEAMYNSMMYNNMYIQE